MDHQAGLFEAMGVTMPPRLRPAISDASMIAEAALAFGNDAARRRPEILDGSTAEDFRDELLAVLPVFDTDGTELAKAMGRTHGYEVDRDLIDLMAEWDGHLSETHGKRVAEWVRETRPQAPFDDVARVEFKGPRGTLAGVAYRSSHYEATARCLVVPDAEVDRFVRGGVFTGGNIVDWEDVTVTSEPTEADRATYRATQDEEARRMRDREYRGFCFARDKAHDTAVERFFKEARVLDGDELRGRLGDAVAKVFASVSQPGFDPASPDAAEVQALLRVMRARSNRDAFERRDAGPAFAG